MNTRLYASAADLKGFSVKNCPPLPAPAAMLMCPPDYYDVSEPRNPFMAVSLGTVNKTLARAQWRAVVDAIEAHGKKVHLIDPVLGLEDMVFAANQTLTGLGGRMEKICLLSQMRHPARRGEVAHFERWFSGRGYRTVRLSDPTLTFEGMGDCLWHPGRRLLWGGYGFRTDSEVYEEVARVFEVPVVILKLVNERFYHLDTCFCPLSPEAVLIYPPAFDPHSLELILKIFPIVLAAEEKEAVEKMACNALVLDSRTALIQAGAVNAARHMRALGLEVVELDTSEFIKSGASVFCLKMPLY
jgi:N-dimethylarginine dimethylaminohydrolase